MIPYSTQDINEGDIKAVVDVLRSDWITRGPMIATFEAAVAKAVGVKFAVAFTSGTAALHGAYFAAGVGKGDEVITSPLTFASTANMALWQGADVVFADIDPKTGNLDPREVAKKITKRTKVVTVVDYSGYPADLDAFKRLAKKYNLLLIEDSVHAMGGVYKNKPIGSISDMSIFSFHPVKPITAGEAGMVTTNNEALYQKLLRFRNHGMTRDKKLWHKKDAPEYHYEMHELGLNYWLTDFQAALGLSQLKRLDTFRKKRAAAAVRYDKLFTQTKGLLLPPKDSATTYSGWHLYAVRLARRPKESLELLVARRDEMFSKLRAAGVGTQVHYMPVYWHPYYQKLGYKKGLCPNAEQFSLSEFSLPLFPALTTKQQRYIVKIVQNVVRNTL
jgi:UDP-4-amino-4,6-dideoxy-N-acetyl-beta-L-altrosamine transaminase